MKSFTVRLPEKLVAEIEAESRNRNVSRSDIVRERLQTPYRTRTAKQSNPLELIRDLIGSVAGLPADLSTNKKKYLPVLIRAKKRPRR